MSQKINFAESTYGTGTPTGLNSFAIVYKAARLVIWIFCLGKNKDKLSLFLFFPSLRNLVFEGLVLKASWELLDPLSSTS